MTYRSLTVCLDNCTVSQRTLEFSIMLAQQHEAHLRAVHMTREPLVFDAYGAAAPFYIEWEKTVAENQARAREESLSTARKFGIELVWDGYCSSENDRFFANARISDLAIISQRDPAGMDTDFDAFFHAKFILNLGRPVLVIPYEKPVASPVLNRLLVAWDNGREAMRALMDAMPFLERARQVTLVTVEGNIADRPETSDADIRAFLATHGVEAEIRCEKNIKSPYGDWLLEHAAQTGTELLVMGAYAHSRLGEMILGGVTRSVLHKMHLPVLMSH